MMPNELYLLQHLEKNRVPCPLIHLRNLIKITFLGNCLQDINIETFGIHFV